MPWSMRRRVGIERDAHARRLPEHIGDVHIFKSVKRRLPLLLDRKMGDVVLQHVVLRFQRRELRNETGVAGGVEDNISDPEQREARRCGQQQRRAAR